MVSRLVILHEEAEDGNAMPDLARPVQAVSLAVNNLVKVLDYLGVAEVIDTMEDLVQFLRDISPALSKAAREFLIIYLLYPRVIRRLCAAGGVTCHRADPSAAQRAADPLPGECQAIGARPHLCHEDVHTHPVRSVLQLTSYVEDGGEKDNVAVLRALHDIVQSKAPAAHRFLAEPDALRHSAGERALRSVLTAGQRATDHLAPAHADALAATVRSGEINADLLCDERQYGRGRDPKLLYIASRPDNCAARCPGSCERWSAWSEWECAARRSRAAAACSTGTPGRESKFEEKANALEAFSKRATAAAEMVAANVRHNKRVADPLLHAAREVEKLSPQLICAGKIRLHYPDSKVAEEHFNNLKNQYSDVVLKCRDLCDQALDPLDFVRTAGELMQKHTYLCEQAIRNNDSQKMVDNMSAIARLANRVLLVGGAERENTDDSEFAHALLGAQQRLQEAIPPAILKASSGVEAALAGHHRAPSPAPAAAPPAPPPPAVSCVRVSEPAPPRPPPPSLAPPRPPPPDTDDEGEDIFDRQPHPSQPILDNEIIAAAKRMAVLMARLSDLVRSDSKGSKRELIATAKAIAEASEEVTRLAKKLALECTDKRIRTNLLQVCERIPTIGTQLKILSTVKATMLGAQGEGDGEGCGGRVHQDPHGAGSIPSALGETIAVVPRVDQADIYTTSWTPAHGAPTIVQDITWDIVYFLNSLI
ncbi:unnamed protein product [Leptidea sinapis]|uniref:Vinculin n=1 Tax=Leptidea sinapis TaxID=189913 RepID=A0A5E4PNE1_9NEOP|nr:unnamed protein product [Leptidea sinapis]